MKNILFLLLANFFLSNFSFAFSPSDSSIIHSNSYISSNSPVFNNFISYTRYIATVIDKNSSVQQRLYAVRAIIDNGYIADTVYTDSYGRAVWENSPVFTGLDISDNSLNSLKNNAAAYSTEKGACFIANFSNFYNLNSNSRAHIFIYNIQGQLIQKLSAPLSNGWVFLNWNGKNFAGNFVAPGIYPYAISFNNYTITGKINTISKFVWDASDFYKFNNFINNTSNLNSNSYNFNIKHNSNSLHKINSTFTLRLEATKDSQPIRTTEKTVTINDGDDLRETIYVEMLPSKVDYIIYAKDINTKEPIEGVTIDLIRGGEIKYSATSDDNGIIIMNDVKTPGYNAYIYAPEGYYGVSNIGFLVPQPWSEKELTDTLIVYLWNKDRPLPGTNRTIRPTLEEIKEMAPAEPNIQRALGKEVHSINTSYYPEEQLKNAQAFYHHVDSLVYNGEWNIQLRLNQPFETSISYGASFTLENIEAYGYNVNTNGGSNNEHYGKTLTIARAPAQNYTTVGTAYISLFPNEVDPKDLNVVIQGKEIVFRLGDYVPVGSRNSIGNSIAEWFTETDRALLYSYLVHNRATLTNYKVIYYTPRQLSE